MEMQILIMLALMMIIFKMVIAKLLFMLDIWLNEVRDISNVRDVKKDKQRINACSMTSKKTVVLMHTRRK